MLILSGYVTVAVFRIGGCRSFLNQVLVFRRVRRDHLAVRYLHYEKSAHVEKGGAQGSPFGLAYCYEYLFV